MKFLTVLFLSGLGFALWQSQATSELMVNDQRPELGAVRWMRDLGKAAKISANTGKPLFVQFQEVPG